MYFVFHGVVSPLEYSLLLQTPSYTIFHSVAWVSVFVNVITEDVFNSFGSTTLSNRLFL